MNTYLKHFLAIFALTFTTMLFSCTTIPPESSKDLNTIIENSYQEYIDLNADGTDINAMLSYLSLDLMTNSNKRTTWTEYKKKVNQYLLMAEKEHISPNYTILAGSNEVVIVSNFFHKVIFSLQESQVEQAEVPWQVSPVVQNLLIKIHESEYGKNE